MPEQCGRGFEGALLSGYLDGALTQADEQRVRVHLEDCGTCRAQVEQMRRFREVIMSTKFDVPPDDQWSEQPRSTASRLSFGAGWTIVALWALALGGYAAWELWTSDENPGIALVGELLRSGDAIYVNSLVTAEGGNRCAFRSEVLGAEAERTLRWDVPGRAPDLATDALTLRDRGEPQRALSDGARVGRAGHRAASPPPARASAAHHDSILRAGACRTLPGLPG